MDNYILPPVARITIEIDTLSGGARMQSTHTLPANYLAVVFAQLIQQILTQQAKHLSNETEKLMQQAKPGNGAQS